MSDVIYQPKKQLRRQCRRVRDALAAEQRRKASELICDQIGNWEVFKRGEVISTYMPMRGEVDVTPLLVRHPEKCWVLPRIVPGEGHRMVFHAYISSAMVRHRYGMLEPAVDWPLVPNESIQLALVPGLAFDRQGWRLGYGGGYYDRFLKKYPGISVGVTFEALLLAGLPHDEHDVHMDYIATESGLFKAGFSDV